MKWLVPVPRSLDSHADDSTSESCEERVLFAACFLLLASRHFSKTRGTRTTNDWSFLAFLAMNAAAPHQESLQERLLDQDVIVEEALNEASVVQGEKQPNRLRDWPAALLFLAHQILLVRYAILHGFPSFTLEYDDHTEVSFGGLWKLGLWIVFIASGASLLLVAILGFLIDHYLVEFAIFLSLLLNGVLIYIATLLHAWTGLGLGILAVLLGACYVKLIWYRIAFAKANLQTAGTALKSNPGLLLISYGFIVVLVLWLFFWMAAAVGLYAQSATCDVNVCESHLSGAWILLLFLSLYWTVSVVMNTLHATVAGIVGTWWFAPEEARGCWAPALSDSLVRATTYSFGSICLGSLVTAVLQVAHQAVHGMRRHGRHSALLLCVVECLIGVLERAVAYFNKWAYVYVGLYGYTYLEAGRKVTTLFMDRGWTTIINDSLVSRVLSILALFLALLTGCLGYMIGTYKPSWVEEFGPEVGAGVAFLWSFVIGLGMASVLMSTIASAVDTVVVAMAEAPLEFERNHPGLYTSMIAAWRQVYPDDMGL